MFKDILHGHFLIISNGLWDTRKNTQILALEKLSNSNYFLGKSLDFILLILMILQDQENQKLHLSSCIKLSLTMGSLLNKNKF